MTHIPELESGRGQVDLNYLFHRQQVERTRAETAASEEAREIHEQLARQYEAQIEKLTAAEFSFPAEQ